MDSMIQEKQEELKELVEQHSEAVKEANELNQEWIRLGYNPSEADKVKRLHEQKQDEILSFKRRIEVIRNQIATMIDMSREKKLDSLQEKLVRQGRFVPNHDPKSPIWKRRE